MTIKLFYLFITVLFCSINNSDAGLSMGRLGHLEINAIYECPDKEKYIDDKISVKIQLKEVANGKAVFATVTSQYDFDNSFTFTGELQRMENGGWKKVIGFKGKWCVYVQRYFSKFWTKLISELKPKPDKLCPIKAGNYSLENFQAKTKDIGLPAIFYGKLLYTVTAFDKDRKPWFCYIAEVSSRPP